MVECHGESSKEVLEAPRWFTASAKAVAASVRFPGNEDRRGYWTAARPEEVQAWEQQDYVVRGDTIRFMWEYSVRIPLWDEWALLPDDPQWLRSALGLSDSLIGDLGEWGAAMVYSFDDHPRMGSGRVNRDLDQRAQALVERLGEELGPRFTVTYYPWAVA